MLVVPKNLTAVTVKISIILLFWQWQLSDFFFFFVSFNREDWTFPDQFRRGPDPGRHRRPQDQDTARIQAVSARSPIGQHQHPGREDLLHPEPPLRRCRSGGVLLGRERQRTAPARYQGTERGEIVGTVTGIPGRRYRDTIARFVDGVRYRLVVRLVYPIHAEFRPRYVTERSRRTAGPQPD